MLLGCFVHLAYLATRSLWVPILLHFLNNAFAVVVYYLLSRLGGTIEQADPGASGLPGWAGLAIGLVIVAASLLPAWGLYRLRDRRVAVA